MPDAISYSSPALDCRNAVELAAFYAGILGGAVTQPAVGHSRLPGGRIAFQTIADHTPPTRPQGAAPTQMHLDFTVDDPMATEARAVGRRHRYAFQPKDEHCLCSPTWPVTRSA